MPKSLSHLSDESTQNTNTANVLTPILTLEPETGTYWKLKNRVPSGSSMGIPLIMDLRDSGDNAITSDTTLLMRVTRPGDSEPKAVSVEQTNLAAWNTISLADQRDKDNVDAIKVELEAPHVNITHRDDLTIEINSADVVDWTNSELYIAREAVDEYPMGNH